MGGGKFCFLPWHMFKSTKRKHTQEKKLQKPMNLMLHYCTYCINIFDSGLAVQPNPSHGESADPTESIFSQAEQDSNPPPSSSGGGSRRRTITMYQSGFTVDDGPYRRLNDPANREFLTALAQGRVPRELASESDAGGGVEVGLIDKRKEEYVPTFSSFSGAGESLGSASNTTSSSEGVFTPSSDATAMSPASGDGVTSVQIRLLSGKRVVIKMLKTSPVQELGERINASGMAGSDPYLLVAGFPPKPILDLTQSIQSAGIAGASVQQKKA